MRATASDVARLASVSVSTVSRALSAPDMVSTPTLHKVQQAAERLGYLPNRAARGLVTGRTGNLALIIPDLNNPYFAGLAKEIQEQARTRGLHMFLADSDEDPRVELQITQGIAAQVDGVLLCSPRAGTAELLDAAGRTPVVMLNRSLSGVASVVPDHHDAALQALRHLWALGHSEIGYVGGPRNSWSNTARLEAFTQISAELDGVHGRELGSFQPYFSGGVAAADIVFATEVSAVVVYNDLMALGLLDRAQRRGVRVPEQLSVVSFDDIPFARSVTPHLSSIAVSGEEMARRALDSLAEAQHGSTTSAEEPPHHVVPVDLTVRDSTGPRPSTPTRPA